MAAVTDLKLFKQAHHQMRGVETADEPRRMPAKRRIRADEGVVSHLGNSAPTLLNLDPPAARFGWKTGPTNRLTFGRELGPYVLLELLGRGAQGEVWKAARLEPPGELVALKVLKPGLRSNPARMAQFRREAERGIRLAGPSLLKVYELGEIEGHVYMTMPYVEGTPLNEVIRCRRSYLAGDETEPNHAFAAMRCEEYRNSMIRLLAKMARALAGVHDQCIAHRDIKPANILLDNRQIGTAYLCDFGLGRDLEIATTQQMRDGAGTPMYMAPERLLRLAADEVKCDIYSLGVTIFEALTLHRPFVVPDHVGLPALAPYLASARPQRPSDICPEFPAELEEIIVKTMAPEPGRRFDSARELALHLERYLARSSFRLRRSLAKPPHWSRLSAAEDEGARTRPQDQKGEPVDFTPHTIKLAALPINGSDFGQGVRVG
jgi:serine/threonine protein kinase